MQGKWYPPQFSDLDKAIKIGFLEKKGAGAFPGLRKSQEIKGCIVPHHDYQTAAPAMSWAYKLIGESTLAKTYIIISGDEQKDMKYDFTTSLFNDWETPFGPVKVDKEKGQLFLKNCTLLQNQLDPFIQEKAIEVQLPFLQFVNMDHLHDIKFLPIKIKSKDYKTLVSFGQELAQLENVCVIVCCNFTQYGKTFNFVPFIFGKQENIYNLDAGIIQSIKDLDSATFLQEQAKSNLSNPSGIMVFIEYAKKLGKTKSELHNYYTSGDLNNYKSDSVSYATMSI